MADNITINQGAGGATIIAENTVDTTYIAVSKIHNGVQDVDGGPITAANPFNVDIATVGQAALAAAGSAISGKPLPIGVTDGTNVQYASVGSAANQTAATNGNKALMVATAGAWQSNNVPGTAAQASVAKAAGGAGVRHICTGFSVSIACGATAQTPIMAYLRDGTTGAGTILWAEALSAPVDGCARASATGLNIIGSEATAMTLEFAGAGVAATQQAVTLHGYDIV